MSDEPKELSTRPLERADSSLGIATRQGSNPVYDYAPAAIQNPGSNLMQIWWCAVGVYEGGRVVNGSPHTDGIFYAVYDVAARRFAAAPRQVLFATGASSWDGKHVCDPTVVTGNFRRPNDATTYRYAMYYTANRVKSTCPDGNNSIGLALSVDGASWVKHPAPVLRTARMDECAYGAGQASAYKTDANAGVRLFFTDATPSRGTRVFSAASADGISFPGNGTFTNRSEVTQRGLPDPNPNDGKPFQFSNSDFGFDHATGRWYAAVNYEGRPGERESRAFRVYRIAAASIFNPSASWEPYGGPVDVQVTGFALNHSPALLKDGFGNVTPHLAGGLEVFYSHSYCCTTADYREPNRWDIGLVRVSP